MADDFFALVQEQRQKQAAWFEEIRKAAHASGQSDYDYAVANNLFTGTREEFVKAKGSAIDEDQVEAIVTPLVADAAAGQAKVVVNAKVDGVASFAALRQIKPEKEGSRIYLASYNEGYNNISKRPQGGGWFVGHLTTAADDGGYIAAGSGFHWKRDVEPYELTVLDFGAQSGGVFDCHDAIVRNYEFTIKTYTNTLSDGLGNILRIQFPHGKFYFSPVDLRKYGDPVNPNATDFGQNLSGYKALSQLHIAGAGMNYGKSIGTILTSNGAAEPFIWANHRCVSVRNLMVDGGQTLKMNNTTKLLPGTVEGVDDFNKYAVNKQPFFTNECPAGEFVRVEAVTCQNMGGHGFLLTDILDTKFDQVYGNHSCAPFLITRWSDPELKYKTGGWNHSTALELSNFNFQYYSCPALWLPRNGQGLISNGWVEHSYMAGQWDNCQFVIDVFNVEDCRYNLLAWQARFAGMRQISGPTGNYFDFDTGPSDPEWRGYKINPDGSPITVWLDGGSYETGWSRFEATYSQFNHPIIPHVYSGIIRGNLPAAASYLNLGSFDFKQIGGHARIEILMRNEYGSMGSTTTAMAPTGSRLPGKLIIDVCREGGKSMNVSWYSEGATGVTEVRAGVQDLNNMLPSLWVRMPGLGGDAYGQFVVNVTTTEITRRDAGAWGKFNPDGKTWSAAAPANTVVATGAFAFHNNQAGIGARNDVVAIQSRSTTHSKAAPLQNLADFSKPYKASTVVINGEKLVMAFWALQPVITTQPAANTAATIGGTLTLTVVASEDAARYLWQKSTDGGTTWVDITNSNLATYTKSSLVAGDAGMYRVIVKGKLENADDTVTTNRVISTTATVTVA